MRAMVCAASVLTMGLFELSVTPSAARAATSAALPEPAARAKEPTVAETEGEPRGGAEPEAAYDCAFGLAFWCFAHTARLAPAPATKLRLEAYGGYKPNNLYYGDEIRSCELAGCSIRFDGPAFGMDAFYNVAGDPYGDRYFDVGLSTSYMPIVRSIENNAAGFDGELGRVEPGDGALGYVPVRLTLRRPNFLYVLKSHYLISSFGAGVAFPVTSGAGGSFTGGDGPKATLGGRLGAQLPVTDTWKVGLTTNWSVIWYGTSFEQASFQVSYGLNVSYQL